MYEKEIQERLHPHYRGLKRESGLTWLGGVLGRLEETQEPGLKEIVRSFVMQMNRRDMADGFLLELMVADSFLGLSPNVFGNRREGEATAPCDVTLKLDGHRVDVQCKAIRNMTNELHVEELISWLEKHFRDLDPGLAVEIEPNTAANATTMQELRAQLVSSLGSDSAGTDLHFVDSLGTGVVKLRFSETDDGPGVHVEGVFSSADVIGMARQLDVEGDRGIIRSRIQGSSHTFGFPISPAQQNLVAIAVPSGALMFEEHLVKMLYGQTQYEITQGVGVTNKRFEPSGMLVDSRNHPYCSGLLLIKRRPDGYEGMIYPRPWLAAEMVDFWQSRPGFEVLTGIKY